MEKAMKNETANKNIIEYLQFYKHQQEEGTRKKQRLVKMKLKE
jgi:hypothetical protein